jgi:hypothetical protein
MFLGPRKLLQVISVPNKILDLSIEKAFPNGMSPIDLKNMKDIKQVMKSNDYKHQDFSM